MKRLTWGIGAALLSAGAAMAHELDQVHAHMGGVVVFGVPFWLWAVAAAAIVASGLVLAMKRRASEIRQAAKRREQHDPR